VTVVALETALWPEDVVVVIVVITMVVVAVSVSVEVPVVGPVED